MASTDPNSAIGSALKYIFAGTEPPRKPRKRRVKPKTTRAVSRSLNAASIALEPVPVKSPERAKLINRFAAKRGIPKSLPTAEKAKRILASGLTPREKDQLRRLPTATPKPSVVTADAASQSFFEKKALLVKSEAKTSKKTPKIATEVGRALSGKKGLAGKPHTKERAKAVKRQKARAQKRAIEAGADPYAADPYFGTGLDYASPTVRKAAETTALVGSLAIGGPEVAAVKGLLGAVAKEGGKKIAARSLAKGAIKESVKAGGKRVASKKAVVEVAKSARRGTGTKTAIQRTAANLGSRKAATRYATKAVKTRAGAGARQIGLQAARKAAATAPGRVAVRAAATKPGRVAVGSAKVGGKTAGYALKHPFQTTVGVPLGAAIPAAIGTGSVEPLKDAASGTAAIASTLRDIASGVSKLAPGEFAENLVRDAFELPAQVLPSLYLPAAGAFEAAKGDSTRIEGLWNDYLSFGLLPAIAKGDPDAALEAFQNHPLYAALEVSGAKAVVGRTAGATVRTGALGGTLKRVGSTDRAPLKVYGSIEKPRRYSPDLIQKGFQVGADKVRGRRRDPNVATPRQSSRILAERSDRVVDHIERIRRLHRKETERASEKSRPKGSTADVVSLAVQGIVRSPATFANDLRLYKSKLDGQVKAGGLSSPEIRANRALAGSIEKAIKSGDPHETFAVGRQFIDRHNKIVAGLIERGVLDSHQARKSAAIPFARVYMGAGHKRGVGVVDRNGKPLSVQAIEAEMKRQGVESVGFLTQRLRARKASDYYRAFFGERQRAESGSRRRTGQSTDKGTFDASYDALLDQEVRSQGILDAAVGFDRFASEFGLTKPDGSHFKNFEEAMDALDAPEDFGMQLPEGVEFVPFRIAPWKALRHEIDGAKRHQDIDSAESLRVLDPERANLMDNLTGKALGEAQRPGQGVTVLVPKEVVRRVEAHHDQLRSGEKAIQAITSGFKQTVLPTSTKWMFGNVFEATMRSMFAGLGPFDYLLGRRLRKVLSPEAIEALIPGGHFGSFRNTQVHRDVRQFKGTHIEPFAVALKALRETPGPRQLVNGYKRYSRAVFGLNKILEDTPQFAALGKEARRDVQAQTGRWHHALTLGDDAVLDLANGLRGTEKQIQYSKAIEEVFGQWGKNSPAARRYLSSAAPFWMWARAASRYVLLTLPGKHPIKTGLIAAAEEMTQRERERFGLTLFGERPVPGNLRGSIPNEDGALRPTQFFSSFGVFADYPDFLASQVLPQFNLDAARGVDFKGDKLVNKDGSELTPEQRVGVAAYGQAEAWLPLLTIGRRLQEGGGSSESTSTIFSPEARNPEGFVKAVNKVFNPFATTLPKEVVDYLREPRRDVSIPIGSGSDGGGSSSSGGFSAGGFSSGGGFSTGGFSR